MELFIYKDSSVTSVISVLISFVFRHLPVFFRLVLQNDILAFVISPTEALKGSNQTDKRTGENTNNNPCE